MYGEEYNTQIAKINSLKSELLTTIDARSIAKSDNLREMCTIFNIVSLCFLAGVIVVQFINFSVVNNRVIKPILKVSDEMQEISTGNLSSQFDLEADTSEIGMLVGAMISTKQELNKYIADISSCLNEMAKGNMKRDIEIDYIGDFAPIKHSLTTILYSLNTTLSQINAAAGQVTQGAQQVADGAQELSQGSMSQASAIERLSGNIADMRAQISSSAENAKTASVDTDKSANYVNESNNSMTSMISAMNKINNKSAEIGKIIKTIDDIAFQTNILALNAAVEAAKNTSALIEETIGAVEAGVHIAEETAASLGRVVDASSGVAKMVDLIATASNQQSESIGHVNTGMEQITQVIHTNSATAQQSAAASEELTGQALMLRELVGKFELKDTNS